MKVSFIEPAGFALQRIFVSTGLLLWVNCSTPDVEKPGATSCNIHWPMRRVHICILRMPASDCNDMFYNTAFARENTCACFKPGYEKVSVEIPGYDYRQVSCRQK